MELRDVFEELPTITPDSKLSKAIAVLSRTRAHGVAVVDGRKKFIGVIDDRTLRGIRDDAELTKARAIAEMTMVLDADTATAEDAITYFLNSHSRVLPVMRNGTVAGCITRASVMGLVIGKQVVKGKRMSEYMHAPLVVHEGDSIAQATSHMRENNSYHAIVTGDSGSMSGFLTSYDLATKVVPHYRARFRTDRAPVTEEGVESESVAGIMNPVPKWVRPDAMLEDAARMMSKENITALPVIEGGKPVGMLTSTGLLHCCITEGTEKVVVLGLRADERMLKASIEEAGTAFMKKVGKKLDAEMLAIHIKSKLEGAKRRYAVRARLFTRGRVISAGTPDTTGHRSVWDAHLSVKEVLDELSRQASDHIHGRRPMRKREWDAE